MRFKTFIVGKWDKTDVDVTVSPKTRDWPDEYYHEAEVFWQETLKTGKRLFNGRLSSLASAHARNGKLMLTLGEICYRDQMFSNHKMQYWRPEEREKYATRGLGISAIVETLDQQVLMIVRSQHVSGHAGFLDVIGGHIDPQKHARNGDVPDVFYAIEDEIHCELGVAFDHIAKTVCIGLIENTEWLKPELVFISQLSLTKAECLECAKQAEEGFEYSAIASFPARVSGIAAFLEKNAQKCTPSAEGSLHLYKNFCNSAANLPTVRDIPSNFIPT